MRLALNATPFETNPQSPAAFVLRERLIALRRLRALERAVGLFRGRPVGELGDLFDQMRAADRDDGGWSQLLFEQRDLPRLAAQAEVDLLWSLGRRAPLQSPAPIALELTPADTGPVDSFSDRLGRAMGEAGAAGVRLRYRWRDASAREDRLQPTVELDPFVDPAFRVTKAGGDADIARLLELPAAYVLSHGEAERSMAWLVAAWSWVDASVGDQIPLVIAGLNSKARSAVQQDINSKDLAGSVMILEEVSWEQLPALYRGAQAFLHSGLTASGQEFRWALATGVPVAAFERPPVAAIAGGAAYLTPVGDARALGAACLTLLVEPKEMAEPLRQKGLMRASSYHGEEKVKSWAEVLVAASERRKG